MTLSFVLVLVLIPVSACSCRHSILSSTSTRSSHSPFFLLTYLSIYRYRIPHRCAVIFDYRPLPPASFPPAFHSPTSRVVRRPHPSRRHPLPLMAPSATPKAPTTSTPTAMVQSHPASHHDNDRAHNDPSVLRANQWILKYHDVWSRLTLSSFYKELEERSLSAPQYYRWLLDRTSVSISLVKAATRTNEVLRLAMPGTELPLLSVAKDDAHFLAQYAEMSGFDICSEFRLSHAAYRLVDFIDASTAPEAPLIVAITAVWTYMLASWQAWALCKRRRHTIPPHFSAIAHFLARDESISMLVDTQSLLDRLLEGAQGADDFDKAGKAFEEVSKRSCAVLDHTLYMGNDNQVPLCTCGRKGHFPEQCTFKSHF